MYIIKSYAKLNLMLKISQRRKNDGYHLLHSLFSYINLYDQLSITPNNNQGSSLFINGPFSSSFNNYSNEEIDSNLVSKTLKVFSRKFHFTPNFDIVLTKNIPIKSGLGGGSSNAAVIARFLNQYFNLKLSNSDLIDIMAPIGADIPFFLQPQMAFCEGIGEKITPMPFYELNGQPVVLVYPNFSLPTPQVFKILNLKLGQKDNAMLKEINNFKDIMPSLGANDLFKYFHHFGNDLVTASIKMFFEIKELIDTMKVHEGVQYASMSGSGSACFALCESANAAQKLRTYLQNRFRGYKCEITSLLSQIQHENILPSSQPCFHRESFMENELDNENESTLIFKKELAI